MRAGVEERLDGSVLLPDGQDVVSTDRRFEEVAGLRDLALVAEELPGTPEDQLHLLLEDVLVAEDATVDLTSLERHEIVEPFGRDVTHGIHLRWGRCHWEPDSHRTAFRPAGRALGSPMWSVGASGHGSPV